jgi:hypothetical protein
MPEILCELCGKQRSVSPREYSLHKLHFCSRKCFFEYRKKEHYYCSNPIYAMDILYKRMAEAKSEVKK